ncbi:hypothetical protein A2U01_0058036, partial [Trifolium medium]|nr:hypothetical protein [Trifolium medium]
MNQLKGMWSRERNPALEERLSSKCLAALKYQHTHNLLPTNDWIRADNESHNPCFAPGS